MTTPTNSHKAWTDKGGHVTLTAAAGQAVMAVGCLGRRDQQRQQVIAHQPRGGAPGGGVAWSGLRIPENLDDHPAQIGAAGRMKTEGIAAE